MTDFQTHDDGAMRVSVGNLGLEASGGPDALDDLVGRLAAFGARA